MKKTSALVLLLMLASACDASVISRPTLSAANSATLPTPAEPTLSAANSTTLPTPAEDRRTPTNMPESIFATATSAPVAQAELETSTAPPTLTSVATAALIQSQTPPAATVTLTLIPVDTQVGCPYEWFFASPPGNCPETAVLDSYAAAQKFEHGQMIWVEGMDVFYILFEAGVHPGDTRQAYRTVGPLVFRPGASPDNRVGEAPPPGYYEPVSGFGLIWRNEVEGLDTNIRAALGWASEPEFGFQTAWQCQEQTTYSSRTCYLLTSDGNVLVLGWGAVTGSVWYQNH